MDYSGIKKVGDFGFNYTIEHLGTMRGIEIDGNKIHALLITFIFDQMPAGIIKKAQKEFLSEFSGIDVHFRIPWSKVISA
tara:strand:+ start:330 stop:569 length:240 start_codon:yes stop_codon:yes gene_type:complete